MLGMGTRLSQGLYPQTEEYGEVVHPCLPPQQKGSLGSIRQDCPSAAFAVGMPQPPVVKMFKRLSLDQVRLVYMYMYAVWCDAGLISTQESATLMLFPAETDSFISVIGCCSPSTIKSIVCVDIIQLNLLHE